MMAHNRKGSICEVLVLGLLLVPQWSGAHERSGADEEQILAIHRGLIASHLNRDAKAIVAAEADEITVVSRGDVLLLKKADRLAQFENYLSQVEFKEYRDLVAPTVRVSEDGTLGWLIAQVRIRGSGRDNDGIIAPFEWTWAWIELYEKQSGKWLRVGEVSNMKPMGE